MAAARQKLMKLSITVVATTTFVFGDMAPVISEGPSTHSRCNRSPTNLPQIFERHTDSIVEVRMLKRAGRQCWPHLGIRVQSEQIGNRRETHLGRVRTSK